MTFLYFMLWCFLFKLLKQKQFIHTSYFVSDLILNSVLNEEYLIHIYIYLIMMFIFCGQTFIGSETATKLL